MENYMRGKGKMENEMGKENIFISMAQFMKANGKGIEDMGTVKSLI